VAETKALQAKRSPDQGTAEQQRNESKDRYWDQWATFSNAASTLAIAVFTLFLVLSARKQAEATAASVRAMQESTRVAMEALDHARNTAKDTLDEMRRATNLSLRAWLVVDSLDLVELNPYPRPWKESIFRAVVRNAGKLPALSIAADFTAELIPDSDPVPKVLVNVGPEGVVVAAGEIKTFAYMLGDISHERIWALRSKQLSLFVTLKLSYTDALGTTGETVHSGHYVPASGERGEYIHNDRDGRSMI
jgi:hypothetical protein